MQILSPFGVANREPLFMISDCYIVRHFIMGEKHLKLILAEKSSGIYGKSIEGIMWNAEDFLKSFEKYFTKPISLLGKLKLNNWNGVEKVQFEIEDIMLQ